MSRAESIVKSGAIISSFGSALFVAFVAVLLIFPVNKECESEDTKCAFSSTAPEPFGMIVQPGYLATALLFIATGVLMVRFGRSRGLKKTGRDE